MQDRQRFPYRVFNPDDPAEVERQRQAIGDLLIEHDRLINKAVHSATHRYNRADHEDICQYVQMHLFRYSLPRFDATKGTKVTTFMYQCAWRLALQGAKPKKLAIKASTNIYWGAIADRAADRQSTPYDPAYRLADRILTNPRNYMGRGPARVLTALIDMQAAPGEYSAVAERLGFANVCSISTALCRMRELVSRLDPTEEMVKPPRTPKATAQPKVKAPKVKAPPKIRTPKVADTRPRRPYHQGGVQAFRDGRLVATYPTYAAAARAIGADEASVRRVAIGTRNIAKGYTFKHPEPQEATP